MGGGWMQKGFAANVPPALHQVNHADVMGAML
jgi:hypothetical protein